MRPAIDLGCCNHCGGCIEICPDVFSFNENVGYIEVAELTEYPQDKVDEAIKNCPEDCISWE